MNFITKIIKVPMQLTVRAPFSSGNWKDRDQSAEKVYISQTERNTLSKLLDKIKDSQENSSEREVKFQQGLSQILKKFKVINPAFEAQVNNLHKNL